MPLRRLPAVEEDRDLVSLTSPSTELIDWTERWVGDPLRFYANWGPVARDDVVLGGDAYDEGEFFTSADSGMSRSAT